MKDIIVLLTAQSGIGCSLMREAESRVPPVQKAFDKNRLTVCGNIGLQNFGGFVVLDRVLCVYECLDVFDRQTVVRCLMLKVSMVYVACRGSVLLLPETNLTGL